MTSKNSFRITTTDCWISSPRTLHAPWTRLQGYGSRLPLCGCLPGRPLHAPRHAPCTHFSWWAGRRRPHGSFFTRRSSLKRIVLCPGPWRAQAHAYTHICTVGVYGIDLFHRCRYWSPETQLALQNLGVGYIVYALRTFGTVWFDDIWDTPIYIYI